MDYINLSVEEIRQGYFLDAEAQGYRCNYCGRLYREGEVFPVGDSYLLPERAIAEHIKQEHDGSFAQLIEGGEKYNTFTDTQKELLEKFAQGISDADIARSMGVTASTIRHQKFTFREKAKQAKYYLAVYDQVFSGESSTSKADTMVAVPNSASQVDSRFVLTEKEKEKILKTEFESLSPLRLKKFPLKAKKQFAIISRVAEEFEPGKKYSYQQMRDILKPISDDYSFFTRYLVDYGFMDRTKEGSEYWLV